MAEIVRHMSGAPVWLQYLTTFIAVLALFLSGLSLFLQRRDKKPKLNIEGSFGGVTYEPEPLYIFTVSNPRDRTVTLKQITIGLPGFRKRVFGSLRGPQPLPTKLAHGESAMYWVTFKELKRSLREQGYSNSAPVTLRAHDALGNVYEKRTNIRLGSQVPEGEGGSG